MARAVTESSRQLIDRIIAIDRLAKESEEGISDRRAGHQEFSRERIRLHFNQRDLRAEIRVGAHDWHVTVLQEAFVQNHMTNFVSQCETLHRCREFRGDTYYFVGAVQFSSCLAVMAPGLKSVGVVHFVTEDFSDNDIECQGEEFRRTGRRGDSKGVSPPPHSVQELLSGLTCWPE